MPRSVVTQTQAILAVKRARKSSVTAVTAEQMFAVGIPWDAIDLMGAWRAAASGRMTTLTRAGLVDRDGYREVPAAAGFAGFGTYPFRPVNHWIRGTAC